LLWFVQVSNFLGLKMLQWTPWIYFWQ
jgi:hypothetical protein